MEDYLDDHKERAFKSSFMEPARFYYHLLNNHMGRDHVNVHGLNWVGFLFVFVSERLDLSALTFLH